MGHKPRKGSTMSETNEKKRWATWKEDELLIQGRLTLIPDTKHELPNLVVDVKAFYEKNEGCFWSKIDDVTKEAFGMGLKRKVTNTTAGKGAKAGYSPKEMLAICTENWKRILEERQWNAKQASGGERMSIQKKYAALKEDETITPEEMAVFEKMAKRLGLA